MKISVVTTTYNWPEALEQVLLALNEQSDANFEVIIADDGSGQPTRELIERLRPQLSYRLIHQWQEDLGFRAARVRNLGILAADGDYIVFLDGDCVPGRNFVARHRALAEEGCFVAGNRASLERELSEKFLRTRTPIWKISLWRWWLFWLAKRINKFRAFLALPLGPLRKLGRGRWKGAMSCNLAVWRRDLLDVDGYDESYEGWGFEDSDLVIRLLNHGISKKSGQFATSVVHLWHPSAHRADHSANLARLDSLRESTKVRADLGLSSHSPVLADVD